MKAKEGMYLVGLRGIAEKFGLAEQHLKYSERELVGMVDLLITSLQSRLEKAKRIYREQQAEINKLKSPELWRFGEISAVPPDYKDEYLRRVRAKDPGFRVGYTPPKNLWKGWDKEGKK